MSDRPILFSTPMVRGLLAGRKSQTRRVLKPQPPAWATHAQELDGLNIKHEWRPWGLFVWTEEPAEPKPLRRWPNDGADEVYGWHGMKLRIARGDRLWVRERLECANGEAIGYPADGTWFPNDHWRWARKSLPSIHMPRAYSRLTLPVTDVRVQRLQEISEDDAIAEGLTPAGIAGWVVPELGDDSAGLNPVAVYRALWEHINGAGSWAANPWVAAYTFTVEHRNIDALASAQP